MDDNNDTDQRRRLGCSHRRTGRADAEAAARAASAPSVSSGAGLFQEFGKGPQTQTQTISTSSLDFQYNLQLNWEEPRLPSKFAAIGPRLGCRT